MHRSSSRAFTLVEMCLVLVIAGAVGMIVFPAMTALRRDMAERVTTENLQALMRASYAFTMANGCLPCPAPAAISGSGFGRVRGEAGTTACAGCDTAEGIVPFLSLGVPVSMAKDGWGRWITMRVDPALTAAFGVAPPSGSAGLCASGLASADRILVRLPSQTLSLASQAALLFLSHGKNGYGAFWANSIPQTINGKQFAFPSGTPNCGTNQGYERCNASKTTEFVDSTPIVSDTDSYDDKLIYMGRNALIASFGAASCSTVW